MTVWRLGSSSWRKAPTYAALSSWWMYLLAGCGSPVQSSVRMAWDDPEASRPYVLEHAQEMDPKVADQHIGLYVNEFTADLGVDGYAAVRGLLTRAAAEGLVPPLGPDALDFP